MCCMWVSGGCVLVSCVWVSGGCVLVCCVLQGDGLCGLAWADPIRCCNCDTLHMFCATAENMVWERIGK